MEINEIGKLNLGKLSKKLAKLSFKSAFFIILNLSILKTQK